MTKRLLILVLLIFIQETDLISLEHQTPPLKRIIIQNLYYPKQGKEKAVYEWRLHASEVREKLGLPKGRVLRRISESSTAYVIWECEYASIEAREKDVAALDKSEEFRAVQDHMSALIDKFERTIWEIDN